MAPYLTLFRFLFSPTLLLLYNCFWQWLICVVSVQKANVGVEFEKKKKFEKIILLVKHVYSLMALAMSRYTHPFIRI